MARRPRLKAAAPRLAPARQAVVGGAGYEARRGSAPERGYDAWWARASRAYKRRHRWCLGCRAVGRWSPSEVTDHIVPFRGDDRLRRDEANWQPACRWHHDMVKQTLERRWEAGELTDEDLRLDSAAAVELTLRLCPAAAGGGINT